MRTAASRPWTSGTESMWKALMLWILHLTWCGLQNLVGAVLCLCLRHCPHTRYRAAIVTQWRRRDGLSLGAFLFVPEGTPVQNPALLRHEYGHTIQSFFLGPWYLLLIGLPSMIWAKLPCFRRLRRERGISYYAVYPENWATRLGDRFSE